MIQKTVRLILLVMLLCAAQSCVAASSGPLITVNGTIRIVGNEPGAHVVLRPGIADKEGDYLITGPLAQELRRDFQGKVVTLQGKICSSPVPQIRRCLKPVKIIVE